MAATEAAEAAATAAREDPEAAAAAAAATAGAAAGAAGSSSYLHTSGARSPELSACSGSQLALLSQRVEPRLVSCSSVATLMPMLCE